MHESDSNTAVSRRGFLTFAGLAGLVGLGGAALFLPRRSPAGDEERAPLGAQVGVQVGGVDSVEKLDKSASEWRELLPADRYQILFADGTERPGSSPLNGEKRAGTYICAACYLPLFSSRAKYESGTGWPSFFESIPDHLATQRDFKLILPRTEYHCARCGGHQGHIFNDGPPPTGKRWCNNGLGLEFVAEGETLPALRT